MRPSERSRVGSGLEIKEGPHGRGVFATRAYAEGEAVEDCPTLELPDAEVVGNLADYVFNSGTDGEVLLLLGFGMLYNHSAEPNVEYVQSEDPRTITFVATRGIEPGEELTISYGDQWWDTRGLEPG
jgi:uncharacterized protein